MSTTLCVLRGADAPRETAGSDTLNTNTRAHPVVKRVREDGMLGS
jgi:hypothetical protein